MDWKTKALLFVLVLFGSVVPASAADGGGTTADVWAIIGVGVVLLGVLVPLMIHFNNVNRDAHKGIGENINKVEENLKADINKVEENLKADINKVEGKVDEINIHLRDSATEAARLGRPSETRKD